MRLCALSIFCLWGILNAAANSAQAAKRELGKTPSFFVLVSKQANEVSLRSFESPPKVLKTYHAITGKVPGDKRVEGDRKTPEGIYFVTRQLPSTRLTALHGAAAFELNYPNPLDRLWKRTGSGIWIHGVDNEERMGKRFDTLGCVALSNEEVVELGGRLEPGFTPVVVVDSEDPVLPVGYLPDTSELGARVADWVKAWSAKDQDAYISFYHPDFHSRGMNRAAWDKYKRNLAKAYKTIDVQISNLRLLRHPKYSVALFHQTYRSDRFKAESDKVVYWVGEGKEAQILSEAVAAENAEPIDPAQNAETAGTPSATLSKNPVPAGQPSL